VGLAFVNEARRIAANIAKLPGLLNSSGAGPLLRGAAAGVAGRAKSEQGAPRRISGGARIPDKNVPHRFTGRASSEAAVFEQRAPICARWYAGGARREALAELGGNQFGGGVPMGLTRTERKLQAEVRDIALLVDMDFWAIEEKLQAAGSQV
jgi:hypothetical protein